MKTNSTIRRLAIIVATIWVTAQAPAMADVPATTQASQQATQIKAPADQSRVILASATCTRVGNRMVC